MRGLDAIYLSQWYPTGELSLVGAFSQQKGAMSAKGAAGRGFEKNEMFNLHRAFTGFQKPFSS